MNRLRGTKETADHKEKVSIIRLRGSSGLRGAFAIIVNSSWKIYIRQEFIFVNPGVP